MTTSDDGSAADGGALVAAVAEGYRATGHDCRVVNHGRDTYVRVWGGGTDGLVWVRPDHDGTDGGLSRFALECERYGVLDRYVLSADDRDPVAPHAAALGIGFTGPDGIAEALRSVDVPVPFEPTANSAVADTVESTDADDDTDSADGKRGASTAQTGLLGRLGGALLAVLALSLAAGVAGLVL